ncbi:MAG TPA: signal peptidase I [Firmicutes bacterium]|nr:signal peptidase I [Bacillota bacterium]
MAEFVDVNKGDILPPLNQKRQKKHSFRKFSRLFLQIFFGLILAVVFAVSGQTLYDFNRYRAFYVNGESMYPTLNKNAEAYAKGNKVATKTYLLGDFSSPNHQYLCDYGLMDEKEGFLSSLQRFSIVVTYFDQDMKKNGDVYLPKSGSELKIKRVLALPGEEIYFDNGGELYIKREGESVFQLIEQPFFNVDPWNEESKDFLLTVKKETNLASKYAYDEEHPCRLGDEEYFLVGDNRLRGCSNDSRAIGPVSSYSIVGRVVTIIGKCWYQIDQNGKGQETIDFKSLIMPWGLELL